MKLIELLVKKHNEEGWEWPDLTGDIIQTHSGNVYIELISSRTLLFRAESIADDRVLVVVTREQYEAALAANKEMLINKPQPVWNGEGLPPVGCECEAFDGVSWFPVVVVGRYDGFAFAWNYDYRKTLTINEEHSNNFRPIRTEAERKRLETETALRTCLAGSGAGITPLAATKIYDAIAAGKIPGVKLEAPDA